MTGLNSPWLITQSAKGTEFDAAVKEILQKSNVHESTKMIQTWGQPREKFVDSTVRPAAAQHAVSPRRRLLLLADNESGMMRGSAILFCF